MSIAGGYDKAVERAEAAGCQCLQIFTKNNTQWSAKKVSHEAVTKFRDALSKYKISHPIAHSSYLINLASPEKALWEKSIAAMVLELERADRLGIPYVVVHPGAYTSSTQTRGIRAIARALNEIHRQTRALGSQCLIETTAGQGTCIGSSFEHLAQIMDRVRNPDRLGVCFDTCHVFAAGYPLGTNADYNNTMRQFDRVLGTRLIKGIHLNDSKTELGSRVDRHAHIGQGFLGLRPFQNILNDGRFQKVPMYLETPKGIQNGKDLDVVNLQTLRRLIRS
ncbi:MAG: deoxyribonuclease IV [Pirellulales bacterium]|nr:deoxyribonuclease IV [Pirellulales bacterium]